jgi:uncharacterized protein (DUF58 family)
VASKVIVDSLLRGEHRSRLKGVSMEFADHKDYVRGDDLKHLDWNAYARLDRLFIKRFEEERDLTLHVLVDSSLSMAQGGSPPKLDYAAQIAGALCYISLANLDRAGACAVSSDLGERIAPRRGRSQVVSVLRMLGRLEGAGRTDLEHCLGRYAALVKRSGLVVLVSDLLDAGGFRRGLARLRHGKSDVIVFHVLAPSDRELPLRGDVEAVDCETGERRTLSVNRLVQEAYRDAVERFCARAKLACTDLGVEYVGVDTSVPFEQAIIAYLVKRRLLR